MAIPNTLRSAYVRNDDVANSPGALFLLKHALGHRGRDDLGQPLVLGEHLHLFPGKTAHGDAIQQTDHGDAPESAPCANVKVRSALPPPSICCQPAPVGCQPSCMRTMSTVASDASPTRAETRS